MAKDYKEKLKDHIARIPAYPGAIISGSAVYKRPIDPETTKKILAKDWKAEVDNKDYSDLTGLTHTAEVKNWAGGGQLTSCNSFVGGCTGAMVGKNLSAFKLEELIKGMGKGHTYVRSTSGRRPEYGDVFTTDWDFAPRLHMGISLGFEGDTWLTVEGGQGGPTTGFDSVKRKRGTFNPGEWAGWCDMRLFADSRGPLPDWLPGTWVIYHGDETFYYRFNQYYEVTQEPHKVGSTAAAAPIDQGTFALGPDDSVVVTWRTEGGIENFKYDRWNSFPAIMERMTGTGAKGEPLKGVRL